MPKKGGKPGGGSSTKKPAEPAADDSFIVFSNSDKDPKPAKAKNKAGGGDAPPNAHDGPALAGETPRVDVKKLIGGASWTGKLPVTLLSEHCRKQRWEQPEYTRMKIDNQFSSMVILKAKNPKTQELVPLQPFKLPPSHKHLAEKPTFLEAKHFAATYALFRVCSMRNIHMMLPPDYRELWRAFDALKKDDVKEGRAWMYEADPFQALRAREEAKALKEKQHAEREKAKLKAASMPGGLGLVLGNKKGEPASADAHPGSRGWARAPDVSMGRQTRVQVEALIRKHAMWNPHGIVLSPSLRSDIVSNLARLGFRPSHVEEAVEDCRDQEETLEWLLVHVPEDDLPRWALPEGYIAGISMASSDLKREASIKRLSEAGYAIDLCTQIYDAHKDETLASQGLQNVLLGRDDPLVTKSASEEDHDKLTSRALFSEESESLKALYGDQFKSITEDMYSIVLEPVSDKKTTSSISLTLYIRRTPSYPHTLPVLTIQARIPAYIRLSLVKRCLLTAEKDCLGDQMLSFIVDYLEHNLYAIMEQPGKLKDVSAAAANIIETRDAPAKKTRPIRHPQTLTTVPNKASKERWLQRQLNPKWEVQIQQRQALPAWSVRDEIVSTVRSCQVTIISGETGSGKSTQSAQFILDDLYSRGLGDATRIICTQPRRISALGLADRVSEERCSTVGDEVGYIIRGESRTSTSTRLTFVTSGVLLRRLQTSGGTHEDMIASLANVSHVIIDEVHERSLDTDFLLVLLRDVLKRRKDLRLILMSATLDAATFERYFQDLGRVGQISISGRTFAVEDYYLDEVIEMTGFQPPRSHRAAPADQDLSHLDAQIANAIQNLGPRISFDLIAALVKEIDEELRHNKDPGGILVFLPGIMEINRTLDALRHIPNLHALPLHSSLQSSEQRRIFPRAPSGKRKVICATNVAETSITIDDIVAVIDSGRVKETSFDPSNNMRRLEEVWVSRAAAKQRRGRAGRVQAGKCYKLYTQNAEETRMAERPEPEIRRIPLEQLCLSIRAMGIEDVHAFLASALTPPEGRAIEGATELLHRMGALESNSMTALGRHLSMIPADLRCGKLMIYGAMFGCLRPAAAIAAILETKSPFVSPQDKRDEAKAKRSSFASNQGDIMGDLAAFQEWEELQQTTRQGHVRNWCSDNFLNYQTLCDIQSSRKQYLEALRDLGFQAGPNDASDLASKHHIIRAIVAGAFNPQMARIDFPDKKFAAAMGGAIEVDPEARTIKYFNQENGRVFVHPSSTLFDAQNFGDAKYVAYFTKMATSKVFVRDLSPFNAYTALLFLGRTNLDLLGRGLIIDGWLRIRGWARIGVLVNQLRSLLDDVLARKIAEPDWDMRSHGVIQVVQRLIEYDGMDQ